MSSRVGRTGRFGRKGCSITFSSDGRSAELIRRIIDETGRPMKRIDARSTTDLEQLEKVSGGGGRGAGVWN